MKRYLPPLAIFIWVTMLSVSMSAQTPVDVYTERLSKTTTASDIRKVLKAAEKNGLPKGDLLELRFAAHQVARQRSRDRTLSQDERISLYEFLDGREKLADQLESYLEEIERSTPDSPEISRTAMLLVKVLHDLPTYKSPTVKERAASAKRRDERVMELYQKALQVESKLDPASTASIALKVLIAEEYLIATEVEKALPLYEESLFAIEQKEGKSSESRVRVLFHLAQIADLAGDTKRFEILTKELSAFGIRFERTVPINARTIVAAEGAVNEGGRMRANFSPASVLHSIGRDQFRPVDGKIRLLPSDMSIRLKQTVRITSGLRSVPHAAIATVDAEGNVTDVELVSPESPKDEVIALVKQWKFRPLIYKGVPTPMKGLVYCWVLQDITK